MKEQTRKNYEDFVAQHGYEPKYAYCQITFCDDGTTIDDVTIKLSRDEDENDNYIFFYCNGLSDILSLYDKGAGEDFIISGVATFGMEV